MIHIPATDNKLAEAHFFCRKLADIGRKVVVHLEPEAFGFYLSAFVSAGRSVTLALQKEEKQRYDAFFSSWGATLTDEQRALMNYFNAQRVETIHKLGIAVDHDVGTMSHYEFLVAAAREGAQIQVFTPPGVAAPDFLRVVRTLNVNGSPTDAVAAAEQYVGLLAEFVAAFKEHYADAP